MAIWDFTMSKYMIASRAYHYANSDIYTGGHSRLMGTEYNSLGFSHSVWKGVSKILSVNIISHCHLDLNLVSLTHKVCTCVD